MAITINQEQRDAIWADIQLDHTALSDLAGCLRRGQADYAQELRQRFEWHWRLLDDLGWARADVRDEFSLTMPTTELVQAIRWHRDRAAEALRGCRDDLKATQDDMAPGFDIDEFLADARQFVDEDLDIVSACDRVLEQVGS
jgi:hypothetical protein